MHRIHIQFGLLLVQESNLSDLFQRLEELRQGGVEEYSISQTNLEHVFMRLANQDTDALQ